MKTPKTALSKFKIEKGIPLPETMWPHSSFRQQLRTMEAGDSVLLSAKTSNTARQAFSQWGWKCALRKQGEQYRVWLINKGWS